VYNDWFEIFECVSFKIWSSISPISILIDEIYTKSLL